MGARRTEKISAVLTPELAARLSEFASRHRWSLSTAVEQLVEQGVSADEIERSARYHQHALYRLRSQEQREHERLTWDKDTDDTTDAPARTPR